MEESQITAMLERIEAHLASRGTPQDVQQAIEDVFNTYGQIAQMREVVQQLVEIVRRHDEESASEREQVEALMKQVRELLRKLVRAQEDLAQAVEASSVAWNGVERRRKAS